VADAVGLAGVRAQLRKASQELNTPFERQLCGGRQRSDPHSLGIIRERRSKQLRISLHECASRVHGINCWKRLVTQNRAIAQQDAKLERL
jgi:hypothetical protein